MKVKFHLEEDWIDVDIDKFTNFLTQLRKLGKLNLHKYNEKFFDDLPNWKETTGQYDIICKMEWKHTIHIYELTTKEEIKINATLENANTMVCKNETKKIYKLAEKYL